ncbi:MAG: hypothetical protein IKC89_06550 [Lentisphaeria bacterium]|nr:hypothetical protein [Lentisphaeria bacterium]
MLKKLTASLLCGMALLSASGAEAVFNYPDALERVPGSNLRVVSYNILAKKWEHQNGARKAEDRAPDVVKIIHQLQPDFAGLQELDPIWYKLLADAIKPWKFAENPYDKNMCAVIYDSRKYRQLDGGMFPFVSKNYAIRCLRWTLLEEIGSGKKFIVTNTHWELKVPRRLKNAGKMAESLKKLQKRFPGIPFFCTGDYNSTRDSEEFTKLLKLSGFKDAVQNAEITENAKLSSTIHPVERKPRFNKTHIDHIVFYGDVKVLSAKLGLGGLLMQSSDHLPLVADFKL